MFADHLRPPQPRRRMLDDLVGLGVGDELVEDHDSRFQAYDLDFAGTISEKIELSLNRIVFLQKKLRFPQNSKFDLRNVFNTKIQDYFFRS